jgi:D-serine dehydratase
MGWESWDPIGVRGLAPVDEYDRYLLHVANLLERSASISEAAAYLDEIASNTTGLGPGTVQGRAASEKTAEAIAQYLRSLNASNNVPRHGRDLILRSDAEHRVSKDVPARAGIHDSDFERRRDNAANVSKSPRM